MTISTEHEARENVPEKIAQMDKIPARALNALCIIASLSPDRVIMPQNRLLAKHCDYTKKRWAAFWEMSGGFRFPPRLEVGERKKYRLKRGQ